jgi:hypothetical protein
MRTRLVLALLTVALVCGVAVTRDARAEQGSVTVAIPGGTLSYAVPGTKVLSFKNPTYVDPSWAGKPIPTSDWWNTHEHAWICTQAYFQLTLEGDVDQLTSQRTGWYCRVIDFPNATSDQMDDLQDNVMSGSFDMSELGADTYCTALRECTPGYHEGSERPLAPINLDPFVGKAVDGVIVISYCADLRYGDGSGVVTALGCSGTWTTFGRGMSLHALADSTSPPVQFSMRVRPSGTDCHVPRLIGLKLATATARLKASNCRLGHVTRIHTGKAKRGRVAGQGFRPRRWLPRHSRVGLVLSKGRRLR